MGSEQSTARPSTKEEIKTLKIVLLGDEGAGKSSISRRLTRHNFVDDYAPTEEVVVEPITRKIKCEGRKQDGSSRQRETKLVSLQIWDLPNQRHEDENGNPSLPPERLLSGTDGLIVVADITRECSVSLGDVYKNQVDRITGKPTPAILIGTKLDVQRAEMERTKSLRTLMRSAAHQMDNEKDNPFAQRPSTTIQTQRLLEEWKKFNLGTEESVENQAAQLKDPDLIYLQTSDDNKPDERDDQSYDSEVDDEDEEIDSPSLNSLKETGKRGGFLKTTALSVKTDTRKLLRAFDALVKEILRGESDADKQAIDKSYDE